MVQGSFDLLDVAYELVDREGGQIEAPVEADGDGAGEAEGFNSC